MQPTTSQSMPSLLSLTNRVARLLTQYFVEKSELAATGLQPQHIGVLNDLWHRDGLRQQDLAIALIKDKATITRLISYLEEKNILVRIADKDDRRTKRIYLTYEGRRLRELLVPRAEQVVEAATEQVSADELLTCLRVLGKIYENLNGCKCNNFNS